jgi:ferredoxin
MIKRRIVIKFPHRLVDQPITYKLVKEYDLTFNILKASVTPKEEGVLVIELSGKKDQYEAGLDYLRSIGVTVQPLSQDVTRDEARCTHCGACISVCPVAALYVDPANRRVIFDSAKCIACELCVKACPPRAMEVRF